MPDLSDEALRGLLIEDPERGWRAFVDQYTPTLLALIARECSSDPAFADTGSINSFFLPGAERWAVNLVGSRRREIGVRMALGATPGTLMRSITGHGLLSVLAGTALGLLGAVLLSRTVAGFVHGISPFDWMTYAGATLAMVLGAAAAGVLASLRVRQISPMDALRAE